MSVNWKPGDVAMVTWSDETGRSYSSIAMRNRRNSGWEHGVDWGGGSVFDDISNPSGRRLVVIDPEDRPQVERLLDGYWAERDKKTGMSPADRAPTKDWYSDFQAALRELAIPTPPALTSMPLDLAARVVDRDGDVWARAGFEPTARWGCLTIRSAPQTWTDLVNVCGPLHLFETTP